MKLLTLLILLVPFALTAEPQWQDATLIKIETGRGHTPLFHDVEVTSYSFKLPDGTVYIADSRNRALDVSLNGPTKLRFEKDGHVGDYIHILDDSGKDRKLHIVGKTAPTPQQKQGFLSTPQAPSKPNSAPPIAAHLHSPHPLTAQAHAVRMSTKQEIT
jgi:hypothetical protein